MLSSGLERVFGFNSFAAALAFTNLVGALAEREGHHPALLTEWGRVTVTWCLSTSSSRWTPGPTGSKAVSTAIGSRSTWRRYPRASLR